MPKSNGQDRVVNIDRGARREAGERSAEQSTPAADAFAARIDALYALAPAALMELDPATLRILRANDRLREIVDLPPEDPAGCTLFDLLPLQDRARLYRAAAAFAEGSDTTVTFPSALGFDVAPGGGEGKPRTGVSLSLRPVRTGPASLVSVLATASPVSSTGIDGENLARACESASIAVAERDQASGRLTRVNASFCRLVG